MWTSNHQPYMGQLHKQAMKPGFTERIGTTNKQINIKNNEHKITNHRYPRARSYLNLVQNRFLYKLKMFSKTKVSTSTYPTNLVKRCSLDMTWVSLYLKLRQKKKRLLQWGFKLVVLFLSANIIIHKSFMFSFYVNKSYREEMIYTYNIIYFYPNDIPRIRQDALFSNWPANMSLHVEIITHKYW